MPARDYQPYTIPLVGGLEERDESVAGSPVGLRVATNLAYDKKGAIRARPAQIRTLGQGTFVRRDILTTGRPSYTTIPAFSTGGGAKVADTWPAVGMFSCRDALGERPGLLTAGRVFTFNDNKWMDRLGFHAASVKRLTEYYTLDATVPSAAPTVADNFGTTSPLSAAVNTAVLLNPDGSVERQVAGAGPPVTPGVGLGTCARSGNFTATVSVAAATNTLLLTVRNGSALSSFQLSTVARTPTGFGDAPCICCDEDSSDFFVAYWTTTGARSYTINRVTTAGSVVNTFTGSITGAGTPRGIWVTNSSVATNKVVAVFTDSATTGVQTKVFNHSLTDQAIDFTWTVNGGVASCRQVTCGCAAGSEVWIVTKQTGNGRPVAISRRSLTAASGTGDTHRFYSNDEAALRILGGGSPSQTFVPEIDILHQPFFAYGSGSTASRRVIVGIVSACGSFGSTFISNVSYENPSTWYQLDVTDSFTVLANASSKRVGVLVAQGPSQGTYHTFQPVTAVRVADGRWRFATADFKLFIPMGSFVNADGLAGANEVMGINEVTLVRPQHDVAGEATYLSGSVPHMLSRGYSYEVGFPWLGKPSVDVTIQAGLGSIPAGSYTVQAVWRWVDEAGQTHLSQPSEPYTVTPGAGSARFDITVSTPQITEREYGTIFADLHITQTNPTATSPHIHIASVDVTPAALTSPTVTYVFTGVAVLAGRFLYTDASVLPNKPIAADGGFVSAGRRAWVSDGEALYASKLIKAGEAPSWNTDDPLTVQLPSTAGQIIALHRLGDRVVALCEKGIWTTGGPGPEDTGVGQEFSEAFKLSDLGSASSRSSVTTTRGVLFQANNLSIDDTRGNQLWLLDSSGGISPVSPALDTLWNNNEDLELAYIPETEQVVISGVADVTQLLFWDMKSNLWATWLPSTDGATHVAAVGGQLWSLGDEPCQWVYDQDEDTTSTQEVITALFETNDLFSNGKDPLSWGRIRSVSLLGKAVADSPQTIDVAVVMDAARTYTGTMVLDVPSGSPTTWPTTNVSPEWRLPTQKCTSLKFRAFPVAPFSFTHIRLDVQPKPGRAPAGRRS